MQVVTRQSQWPDGDTVVEVSRGGIDYTNPDALVGKYPGEFEEIADPREAIETAIEIAKAWQKDSPKLIIKIAVGNTMGNTMPFDGENVKVDTEEVLVEFLSAAPTTLPKSLQGAWAKRKLAREYPDGWNEPLFAALKEQAQKEYDTLPKCDQCGEMLGKETYRLFDYDPDARFCREYCADKYIEVNRLFDEELVED